MIPTEQLIQTIQRMQDQRLAWLSRLAELAERVKANEVTR